jgi:hypothetical protein
MRYIDNKKVSIIEGKEDTYAGLMKICLFYNPDGITGEEQYHRFKIVDAIERDEKEEKDQIALEDSEFELLKSTVLRMKWAIMHRDLRDFVAYIKELA